MILAYALASAAHGHGAAQTSIRLNVYETHMEAYLDVTIVDLVKMAGGDIANIFETASDGLRQFAVEYQGEVQKHFKLIDGVNQILIPSTAWAEIPDFKDKSVQNLGIDQQRIEVVFGYVFETPPESIAVVFELGEDHHGDPVYADVVLRQGGEMTMLPEKVGPGFSLQFEFVWDEPVQPIHTLSDLSQAGIKWQNRPVLSYLHADEMQVTWAVVAPLSAWGERAFDLSQMPSDLLAETLSEGFALRSDEGTVERLRSTAKCFAIDTFDYRMGREIFGGKPEETLVRLDMVFDTSSVASDLEAVCLDFPESSPRLFFSASVRGEEEVFHVLHPGADHFRWDPTLAHNFSYQEIAPVNQSDALNFN
jgi:hypothetical protein